VNETKYKDKLTEMRLAFKKWNQEVGDMSAMNEKDMIRQMWNGGSEPPSTAMPKFTKTNEGIAITCDTKGASIGYQVIKPGPKPVPEMHTVLTWDFTYVFNAAINGTKRPAAPVWEVYNGDHIKLIKGDTLLVNALRIGYKPAIANYVVD
jgi:hypothetical protein